MTTAGAEGPASRMRRPVSSNIALTLPLNLADDEGVALAQGALLDEEGGDRSAGRVEPASTTTATAGRSGFALSSLDLGDERELPSSRSSRPVPFVAETGTVTTSPP